METDSGPQTGTVVRLGAEHRFGYVTDATATRRYILVMG